MVTQIKNLGMDPVNFIGVKIATDGEEITTNDKIISIRKHSYLSCNLTKLHDWYHIFWVLSRKSQGMGTLCNRR